MSTETASVPVGFVRDRATWLAYLLSLYYAYLLNILRPLTPFLRSELGLAYTLASLHFSAFAAGMLLAGATADRVVARLGRRRTLWTGAFGMAGGVIVLIAGRQPTITITACFLTGSVGSWILAVYPAVLADRHGRLAAIAFTEATTLGSAGAAVAPLCLGLLAHTAAGWRARLSCPSLHWHRSSWPSGPNRLPRNLRTRSRTLALGDRPGVCPAPTEPTGRCS